MAVALSVAVSLRADYKACQPEIEVWHFPRRLGSPQSYWTQRCIWGTKIKVSESYDLHVKEPWTTLRTNIPIRRN